MNPGILLLNLPSLQSVNVKASFLHVQNNLIGKINAIILIIVIEDKIAIFMQFVMKGLIRRIFKQFMKLGVCLFLVDTLLTKHKTVRMAILAHRTEDGSFGFISRMERL